MDFKDNNIIYKVCFCENNDEKFSEKSLEVSAQSASVQSPSSTHKQICSICGKIRIKSECDEIHFEETKIIHIYNPKEVNIKNDHENTQNESLPVSFTKVECNSYCHDVKIEQDPLEDPLRDVCFNGDNNICHVSNKSEKRKERTTQITWNCDICNKHFKCSTDLKRHQRRHTGEKPYKCDICDRQFTQVITLQRHKQIHLVTRDKSYKCDICQKDFYTSANLKLHQMTHTADKPYKCNICSNGFRRSTDLKVHQRVHTGEKPYKCYICDKLFARIGSLKRHQQIHNFK